MCQRIGNMPKACPYVMMQFGIYDASTGCKKKIFCERIAFVSALQIFQSKSIKLAFYTFPKDKKLKRKDK